MTSTYSARERFGTTLGVTQNNGGPGQIRTADLRFRKPSLYPSELQGPGMVTVVSLSLASAPEFSRERCESGNRQSLRPSRALDVTTKNNIRRAEYESD